MSTTPDESIANDALRGTRAIAAFRGEKEQRTSYLLEKGIIPAGKEGAVWVASKRALRQHHARLTGVE